MNRLWLIASCCTLIVIYWFQAVSGYDERTSQCTIQCHERCKKIQNVKNTRLRSCEKKCAKLSKLCLNCRGPRRCDRCAPGYKLSAFRRCTDKNECLWNNGGCSANALCINVIGGRVCVCKPGYFGDGKTCTDVDECTTGPFPCNSSVTATCINTMGSFMCKCKTGYDGNGTIGCQDVDECTTGTFPCFSAASATCTNSPGSFKCACKAGYRGDGITSCKDICTSGFFPCYSEVSATCTSSSDSFSCACKNGFRGDGITSCPDVDECTTGPFPCFSAASATCTNTIGSFKCACKPGYTGDGIISCQDINECDTGSYPCYDTDIATCTNSPGSYTCACNEGYCGDGVTSCEDIDECATTLFPCYNAESAVCTNTKGSYKCACAPGFFGDGFAICIDNNECGTTNGECRAKGGTNSVCIPGSFSCTCSTNSLFSGTSCDVYAPCDAASRPFSFTTRTGVIKSANYPNLYPNNLDCGWRIIAPTDSVVKIDFQDFYVEGSSALPWDYVSIYDGAETSSSRLAKLTGILNNPSYTTTQRYMLITFHSDINNDFGNFGTPRGFTATFTISVAYTPLHFGGEC